MQLVAIMPKQRLLVFAPYYKNLAYAFDLLGKIVSQFFLKLAYDGCWKEIGHKLSSCEYLNPTGGAPCFADRWL